MPNPILKSFLFIAAPIPLIRLVFNEALPFFSRVFAYVSLMTESKLAEPILAAVLTLLLLLGMLPFLMFFAGGIAGSSRLRAGFIQFRRCIFGGICLVIVLVWGFCLSRLPAYNSARRPFVRVNAEYDLSKHKGTLKLVGTEYLKGIHIKTDSLDMDLNRNTVRDTLPEKFHANWFEVTGAQYTTAGEKDTMTADWLLASRHPWKRVTFTLKPDTLEIDTVITAWNVKQDEKEARLIWFGNLPDTIHVPIQLVIGKGAGLIRKVEAYYSDMPIDITVTSDLADVRYRTQVTWEDTLKTVNVEREKGNGEEMETGERSP